MRSPWPFALQTIAERLPNRFANELTDIKDVGPCDIARCLSFVEAALKDRFPLTAPRLHELGLDGQFSFLAPQAWKAWKICAGIAGRVPPHDENEVALPKFTLEGLTSPLREHVAAMLQDAELRGKGWTWLTNLVAVWDCGSYNQAYKGLGYANPGALRKTMDAMRKALNLRELIRGSDNTKAKESFGKEAQEIAKWAKPHVEARQRFFTRFSIPA